jgi:hypothetical protein
MNDENELLSTVDDIDLTDFYGFFEINGAQETQLNSTQTKCPQNMHRHAHSTDKIVNLKSKI